MLLKMKERLHIQKTELFLSAALKVVFKKTTPENYMAALANLIKQEINHSFWASMTQPSDNKTALSVMLCCFLKKL